MDFLQNFKTINEEVIEEVIYGLGNLSGESL